MQIPFNLFHINPRASDPEAREVVRALQRCGETIRKFATVKGTWSAPIFTFEFPTVFVPGSDPTQNALALRALLDCLIAINVAYLRTHTVPSLYRSGVVYGRTLVWEPIPALYRRQYGDCKSLTAALIAERRKAGLPANPVFRFMPKGIGLYHILVQAPESDSGFIDPSKVLGMGKDENAWFRH